MKKSLSLKRAVRVWLAENGMTQQQLADMLVIDRATFSRMLNGYRPANEDIASRLKAETGIDLQKYTEVAS